MASIATVVRDVPGQVVVRVVHKDTDSFSRSVDRAANKAWKHTRHARTATYVKGDYAFMDTDNPRECVSVVAYATTFDAARVLVEEYVSIATCTDEHGDCERCGEDGCHGGQCDLPTLEWVMTYAQTLETPAEYELLCGACNPQPDPDDYEGPYGDY